MRRELGALHRPTVEPTPHPPAAGGLQLSGAVRRVGYRASEVKPFQSSPLAPPPVAEAQRTARHGRAVRWAHGNPRGTYPDSDRDARP